MPRIAALFTPGEQLGTLLGCELTPEIARLGHVRILTEPHECGTPNLRVVQSSSFSWRKVRSVDAAGQTRNRPDRLKAELQTLRRQSRIPHFTLFTLKVFLD